jgi:hypothetical protein
LGAEGVVRLVYVNAELLEPGELREALVQD